MADVRNLPDIDLFAKHFATNLNHILDERDPRSARIEKLLTGVEYLSEVQREEMAQA